MSQKLQAAALLGAVLLACPYAAQAADFEITKIGDPGKYTGCIATNAAGSLGYLAVGDKVAMFVTAPAFALAKGANASGTWSIDGAKPEPFAATANGANTVTIDVPNSAEAVMALTTGTTVTVVANGKTVKAPLDGTAQAFTALIGCMGEIESQ